MSFRIRYKPGTRDGDKFASIRYPEPTRARFATREEAERLRALLLHAEQIEVVELLHLRRGTA